MAQRLELQALLIELLESENVYFQPPPSFVMQYPCIVYMLDDVNTEYADNNPYSHINRYQLTIMDQNPDSLIPKKVAMLPTARFSRFFVVENLNHFVYNLFF